LWATVAAVHSDPALHAALIARGPPVSIRVVVPCCDAFGGMPQSPPTGRSACVSVGVEVAALTTRQTVSVHGLGKRVLTTNSAGLDPTLCAGCRLDVSAPPACSCEKSKKLAVAPLSSGGLGMTRIFAPWKSRELASNILAVRYTALSSTPREGRSAKLFVGVTLSVAALNA